MEISEVAARCESIGRNCEFGTVQRHLGHDPISLLRWTGMDTTDLIRGLRTRFAGLGDYIALLPRGQNVWRGVDREYKMDVHLDARPEDDEETVIRANRRRLRWLADKLFDDIRAGEKALIYSSAEWSDPIDGIELLDVLRQIGASGPIILVAAGSERGPWRSDNATWCATLPLTPLRNAISLDLAAWMRLLARIGEAVLASPATASEMLSA